MFGVLLIIALFVPENTIAIASFYLFIVVLFDASQLIVDKILVRRYADHTLDVNLGIIKIESDVLLNQLFTTVVFSTNDLLMNVPMLIDTGSDRGLVLDKSICEKLKLVDTGLEAHVTSITGYPTTKKCYKTNLKIGEKLFKDILVIQSDSNDVHYKGIIGMDIISNCELIIKKENSKFTYSFKA